MTFLEEEIVHLDVEADNPKEAIFQSGELLEKEGYVSENYVKAMVKSYEVNGPYFVIAPAIAIAHARPEDGVNESAVSLVRLAKPIEFGQKQNDPVQLVFGLAASSDSEHLETIKKVVKLLENKENVEGLLDAKNYKDIKKIKEVLRK